LKRIITKDELEKIKLAFADLPKRAPVPQLNEDIKIPKVSGCKVCNNTGFKGRIGLYEMFPVNKESEEVIISKPTQTQLFTMAKRNGLITIKQDGFLKVLAGITTIEEVESVAG